MIRFYAFLSRMKNIRRWALMRATTEENVMEHSFQTAVIAHALALIADKKFGGDFDADRLAALALFHEAGEVVTGDLPTPVKYYNEDIRSAYKALEKKAEEKLLSMLPDFLAEEYRALIAQDATTEEHRLVKAADKIAAYIKCVEETAGGNGEFGRAKESLARELEKYGGEETRYFMEHCVPAFALALDELDLEER